MKAHVPEKPWPELERRLSDASHETSYGTAKASLEATARRRACVKAWRGHRRR